MNCRKRLPAELDCLLVRLQKVCQSTRLVLLAHLNVATGAKVIACASADKHEICKKYGWADYTVDYDSVRL